MAIRDRNYLIKGDSEFTLCQGWVDKAGLFSLMNILRHALLTCNKILVDLSK